MVTHTEEKAKIIKNIFEQEELAIMVKNVDNLLVLFHDRKKKSQKALNALEHIDDDTDKIGVSFVEVDDVKVAAIYGVEEFPTLVYFKHGIPSICEQDLTDNEEVRDNTTVSLAGQFLLVSFHSHKILPSLSFHLFLI